MELMPLFYREMLILVLTRGIIIYCMVEQTSEKLNRMCTRLFIWSAFYEILFGYEMCVLHKFKHLKFIIQADNIATFIYNLISFHVRCYCGGGGGCSL